jgi:hypothetical protein
LRRAALALFTALLLFGCGDGGSAAGGSKAAFCDEVQQLTALDEILSDSSDPEKLAAATSAFDDLTAAAPGEIKSEMAQLNAVYKKITEALAGINADNADEAFAAVFGVIGQFDQQELEQATTKVEAYAKDECGVDITDTASGPIGGETTTTIALGSDSTTTTTAPPGATTTTSTPGGAATTTTTAPAGSDLPPADPVPGGDDEQLNQLAQQCHDGDMQACDDLFNQSDFDSAYEDYGNTCGGRVPDNTDFCVNVYPE